ncbi:Mitochondrial thiamine pyrophosphate carrier, partial [Fasciolopsis buskii]
EVTLLYEYDFIVLSFLSSQFATFYGLSRISTDYMVLTPTGGRDLLLGSISGAAATTCVQPLDVMRTRLVAQGRVKTYTGFLRGFAGLIRTEGVVALWRGLGPSLVLIVPQTSITFATYEKLKRMLAANFFQLDSDGSQSSRGDQLPKAFALIAGALAGLVGKTAVYPLDLIKKRLEIRGFETARQAFGQLPHAHTAASYKLLGTDPTCHPFGLLRTQFYASLLCLKDIIQNEGWCSLFKGWQPSAVKALISTGLTFAFFEHFRHLLRTLFRHE